MTNTHEIELDELLDDLRAQVARMQMPADVRETLIEAVQTAIRSHIEYAGHLWDNEQDELERVRGEIRKIEAALQWLNANAWSAK
jgi:hypothetical protein